MLRNFLGSLQNSGPDEYFSWTISPLNLLEHTSLGGLKIMHSEHYMAFSIVACSEWFRWIQWTYL